MEVELTTDAPDPSTPFEDLPPDLRREVLARINRWAAIVLGGTVVFGALIVVAMKVGIEEPGTIHLGLLIIAALLAYMLPALAGLYLLVLTAGAWTAVLRPRRLASLYGIDPSALSNAELGRIRPRGSVWYALMGLALVGGMMALAGSGWTAATGKPFGPWPAIIGPGIAGGGLMARSRQIRRVVADRRAVSP